MGVYGRRLACPGGRRWLRRGRWAIEHNVLVAAGSLALSREGSGWRARAADGGWLYWEGST